MSLEMANKLPFVALACICEKLLQDKDDVLTLVRVVDTYYLQLPEGAPEGVVGGLDLSGVISIKSGDVKGEFEMLVVLRTPDGKTKPITDKPIPVVLNGGEHGVNIKLSITVAVKEYGLYWFDVMWGNDVLTSIPLKLVQGQKPPRT